MAYNNREYIPTHLTGATTTSQVFSGKGILHGIVINTTSGSTVIAYDSVGNLTGTLAILKASVAEGVYEYHAAMANGCYLTLGGAGDYTVLWTQG